MNLTLQTEAEADIPFLLRFYADSRAEELSAAPWTAEQKTQFLEQQFLSQRAHYYQHYQGASFDLILLDGIPVGRLYVHRGIEIRLMDIIVSPPYQKRGIAKWCFEQLFLEAQASGLDITLHVEVNNHARDWYKRMGFIELEIEATGVYVKMLYAPKAVNSRP
jgi:ribosomal protein S18 acetylase RimI-like enzyme